MASFQELRAALDKAIANGDESAARMFAEDIKSKAGITEYSPTGSFGENWLAGHGRSLVNTGRGIGQMMGMVSQEEIDEANRLDQPLMETGGGMFGNVTGAMSQMPFPITTIPRAVAAGAGYEALQPGSLEERAKGAAVGGALGGTGQLVGDAIGRAVKPIRGKEAAAGLLKKEGIPLSAADETGSRALSGLEETIGFMPGAAGRAQSFKESQQTAFNRAALRRAGIEADAATDQVMDSAYSRFNNMYRQIGNQQIELGEDWWQRLYDMDEIYRTLPDSLKRPKVGALIDDMMDMTEKPISATQLQSTRSALSELSRDLRRSGKKPDMRRMLDKAVSAMDDAVEGSLDNPTAFKEARRQYANLKQIEPVIDEYGNIPVGRLHQKVKSGDKTGYARGRGDLTDLSKAAKQVLPSKLPQSGTAERALWQAAIGSGAGAGYGLLSGDPQMALQGAMYGAALPAIGANVGYRALQSGAGKRYLTEGIPGLKALDSNLVRVLTSTGAIGGGGLLNE